MFERLFEPIKIGSLTLKNRIVLPALGTNLSEFGTVSQRLIDFYTARAQGGVGMIVSQCLFPLDLKLHSRKEDAHAFYGIAVADMKRLSHAIKSGGAKACIQMVHGGAQGVGSAFGSQLVGPSPIPCLISKEIPKELTIDEIAQLVDEFTKASQKAKEGGFDAVEIHGAHGYLISEFLSRYSNKREDLYGGSLENMVRFPCEIISSIRKRLGPDFTIGIRINGDDFVQGGTTIDDAKAMALYLEKAGVDYISVSAGVYGSVKATVPPMMEPRGCFVPLAREIKRTVSVPVITAGRIKDPELAEEILEKGWADLIGMGRSLIADPRLPLKLQKGDVRNIRRCIGCNQGCIDRINKTILPGKDDGEDASLTCTINSSAGKEGILVLTQAIKKRVLIAGAGPAGMEAARISAKRGHEVILIEKTHELGGQLRLAKQVPLKEEIQEAIDYFSFQMERFKVNIIMGKEANVKIIEECAPDVVIVATGARPISPKSMDTGNGVVTAWDVLDGKEGIGQNVLIVGGGAVGLETAHFFAKKGKNVTVVEQFKRFAEEMGPISRFYLRSRLAELHVTLMKSTKFLGKESEGVFVSKDGRKCLLPNFDTIVWAIGAASNNSLMAALKDSPYTIHIVGDANRPRDALCAIAEGHRVALNI